MSFQKKIQNSAIFLLLLFFLIFLHHNLIQAGESLNQRLAGRILLQVEKNGEAWYINPLSLSRHYLGRPEDAYEIMRGYGIGISDENIAKIKPADQTLTGPDSDGDGLVDNLEIALGTDKTQADTDQDGYPDKEELTKGFSPTGKGALKIDKELTDKLAGHILIQAEKNGEAWYLNPGDKKRYYLGRPADALSVMRQTGLGITDADLARVDSFEKLAQTDEMPAQISTNGNLKTYKDTAYGYRVTYPASWLMSNIAGKGETLFLRNYKDDVLTEKKAVMTVSSAKINNLKDLSGFKIDSKEGGKKIASQESEINQHPSLAETFTFSKTDSLEKTVYLKASESQLIIATLFSAGNHDQHEQIFDEMLKTMDFNN
jgi:hypothetical protein